MRALLLLSLALMLTAPSSGEARTRGSPRAEVRPPAAAAGVARDTRGRIQRDPRSRHAFRKTHPCPPTGRIAGACPGHVIDHIVPLKRGGADAPDNMQWQTREAAREKDRWE